MDYDVLILGSGPAGLSSSIYTARGGLKTLVISHSKSPLIWAGHIDNYLGFPEGINGKELYNRSITQAKRFGVHFAYDEIVAIDKEQTNVQLTGVENSYSGKVLLLATGNPPNKVSIKNADRFEGNGVAYCATCDGFFYKDLNVGVLGYKDYAVQEAMELLDYTSNITIYTNGRELVLSGKYVELIKRFTVNTQKIKSLEGKLSLEKIVFEDESEEKADGLFIAFGSASSVDFAKKTGIITENGYVAVDSDQMTNLEGIFAAGACTLSCKTVNQIATSVGQGALAGKKILDYLGKSSIDYYNIRSTK